MCDPVTALMIATTTVAVNSADNAATAKENQFDAQAQVADQNAQISLAMAQLEEDKLNRQLYKIIGSQRAGYAAAGVTMEGTPTDVAVDTVTQGEIDRLSIRYGGAVNAYNSEVQGKMARADARMADSAGDSAVLGTILGGGTSYLKANPGSFGDLGSIFGGGDGTDYGTMLSRPPGGSGGY
jgi:hypothetical protein